MRRALLTDSQSIEDEEDAEEAKGECNGKGVVAIRKRVILVSEYQSEKGKPEVLMWPL